MSTVRWMKAASRVLWVTGIVLAVVFCVLLMRPFEMPKPPEGSGAGQVLDLGQTVDPERQNSDLDLEFLNKRDFFDFQVAASQGQGGDDPAVQGLVGGSGDFLARYKLVGIVIDAKEQAVFEALSDGSVVFLEKGGQLDGYVLKSVSRGEVVLDRQGDLLTVRLFNQP